MEVGDLDDLGHLLRPEHEDEPFMPQHALDEMREAVQRLRRQLHAGPFALPGAAPSEQPSFDGDVE
jgi:hypothetical protein